MHLPEARKPVLAISMGDPAGIGPEVVLKAATFPDVRKEGTLVVFGDVEILRKAARDAAIVMRVEAISEVGDAVHFNDAGQLAVIPGSTLRAEQELWGRPSLEGDRAQVAYVRQGLAAVLADQASALVTAPISKASLSRAGVSWPGHTEMLAELSGSASPAVMMLAGPTLKVVPMTIHVALADVPRLVTAELLTHTIRVTDSAFRAYFGHHQPRIAVAGLNPHAGEGGMFGNEEQLVLRPTIARLAAAGIDVQGPFAGDTVFYRAVAGEYDVVIGMYHDQALIPLKLLDFDSGVNVTLGLPLIRTSVDHGTAYDIAGRGVASSSSMIAALRLAARMARTRGEREGQS